jgi:hypothetical protein
MYVRNFCDTLQASIQRLGVLGLCLISVVNTCIYDSINPKWKKGFGDIGVMVWIILQ